MLAKSAPQIFHLQYFKMKKIIILLLLLFVLSMYGLGQKKIAVLGSSTAAGNGASISDSSWVGKLKLFFNKNAYDGVDTVIDNRAVPGYVTYQSLPTGYSTPSGRPSPDIQRNITYILNEVPRVDVVIINYPSNDITNGYNPKEMMDNLRLMFQQCTANGIPCYITTTQPRNTATEPQRTILKQLVDSIKNNFGDFAINFWDDLVTNDGTNTIKPEVNADGTHPNNYGHRLLFQRVKAKNIFANGTSLPLTIVDFQAHLQNSFVNISWKVAQEEPNSSFELQRSNDGQEFQTIYAKKANNNQVYSWRDDSPLKGKSFYRIKINEPGKISFSRIISVSNGSKQITITNLYTDAYFMHLQINSDKKQTVLLTLVNFNGEIVQKQTIPLSSGNNDFNISISALAAGDYIADMVISNSIDEVHSFSK